VTTEKTFDAHEFGKNLKSIRKTWGLTRNEVAEKINIAPRYLMSIENHGQMPSLQIFYNLVTLFDLSVDQLFRGSGEKQQSDRLRQIDILLEQLRENELLIIEYTVQGILRARQMEEAGEGYCAAPGK
jgi:transcriptional regulator with XRE-family HTH domain